MPREIPSLPSPSLSVPKEIVALRAEGESGDRAASLLLDAAKVLSAPDEFQAPAEVAQACCRGAVDSVWKMAGEDFPGLERAKQSVSDQAKALADRAARGRQLNTAKLAAAVDTLRAEEAKAGRAAVEVGARRWPSSPGPRSCSCTEPSDRVSRCLREVPPGSMAAGTPRRDWRRTRPRTRPGWRGARGCRPPRSAGWRRVRAHTTRVEWIGGLCLDACGYAFVEVVDLPREVSDPLGQEFQDMPAEAELGVRGDHDPDPPVRLSARSRYGFVPNAIAFTDGGVMQAPSP